MLICYVHSVFTVYHDIRHAHGKGVTRSRVISRPLCIWTTRSTLDELLSQVRRSEWSPSHTGRFTHEESAPHYQLSINIGGPLNWSPWFGEATILLHLPGIEHDSRVIHPKIESIATKLHQHLLAFCAKALSDISLGWKERRFKWVSPKRYIDIAPCTKFVFLWEWLTQSC